MPQFQPAGEREALEVRYRAAAGVGEEAHSRQPHWCPWSKPMNVETCGHVADLIVMARAFAELRDGIVARQHKERFQIWAPLEACVDRSGQSLFAFAVWVVVGESYRKAVK